MERISENKHNLIWEVLFGIWYTYLVVTKDSAKPYTILSFGHNTWCFAFTYFLKKSSNSEILESCWTSPVLRLALKNTYQD